ncbi:response regulator transcription factor [Aliigemmobacter aestuarii]|uniref:Response regulator transcription factor n=1 Tax=Aliigemmobacter aestuarii TaxID=1445661 RepID=A0A4S3MMP8_9RHOB|nr:response regulator transcription factor [Gemmobacter aestuarii]THD83668.1 response regulator transcription factor [Gemmobacter aestuarii]
MRLLLADDQELVRDTIAAFLRTSPDLVVDTASDLQGAICAVREKGPYDLVLLDFMMPGMNGLNGIAQMRAEQGSKPVAILSGLSQRYVAEQALAMGAQGFLSKTMSTKSLIAAIRFMVAGEIYAPILMAPAANTVETRGPTGAALTPRETEVLRLLCAGQSNKEIARELQLQEMTVKLHVKALFRKIEARNRTHAAMIARENGLV